MRLKCIIVDDEPLAAELLKSYALKTPFLDVIGVFNSAVEALSIIKTEHLHLVFLDINMPGMSGLEFSKILPAGLKVVFTTAYDEFAIEGFKVNALDYLLKPISYENFLLASNRALDWFLLQDGAQANVDGSIFIKSGYRFEKLFYKNILYIENQKDYVLFYLDDQKEPVKSLMSINQLTEKLVSNNFMRVHRSFIVNLDKIKTVERNYIVFGKVYIPISDSYKDSFYEFLNKKFL